MITFMRRYRRGLQGACSRHRRLRGLALRVRHERIRRQGRAQADTVATVNGETITAEQYQDRYQSATSSTTRSPTAAGSTPELAEQLGLPQRVVDEMVHRAGRRPARGRRGPGPHRRGVQRRRPRHARVPGQRALLDGPLPPLPPGRAAWRPSRSSGASSPCARSSGSSWAACASPTPRSSRRGACAGRRCARAGRMVELAPLVAAATASDRGGGRVPQGARRGVQAARAPQDPVRARHSQGLGAEGQRRRRREVLHRASQGVRDAGARCTAVHLLVRVAETGGSEAEDRARAKVADAIKRAKARRGFRQAGPRDVGGSRLQGQGRRPGLGEQGRRWCRSSSRRCSR